MPRVHAAHQDVDAVSGACYLKQELARAWWGAAHLVLNGVMMPVPQDLLSYNIAPP